MKDKKKIKDFREKHHLTYISPRYENNLATFKNESIMVFDPPENMPYRMCLGIGRIQKVLKGEGLDIVYMRFGRRYARRIIVIDNHARRQVYTLKRGQMATFFGYFQVRKDDEGNINTLFFSMNFQAWFVPKALDIKSFNVEDIEELDKQEESMTLIDEILEGKEI